MGSIKVFSKSTSGRFALWASEQTMRTINEEFTALLAMVGPQNGKLITPSAAFGLSETISFDDIYFDSTCVKADIHFPVDRVLLRDAARTLMKATTLIRKHGLKLRMPQEPLGFLSEMNTLRKKMSAKSHSTDGRKQRKKVLREMKALEKRVASHAKAHVQALKTRREETDLSEAQAKLINQEGFREGLKRRTGTEGRIGVFKNEFLGRPLLAKAFEHRKLAVGWAVLTHNLWVVARIAEAEKKRKEAQESKAVARTKPPRDFEKRVA
jgi:hypothetical protein